MVTQLLFGDAYKVLDERAKWVRIRLAFDAYECWIDRKQNLFIEKEEYEIIAALKGTPVAGDLVSVLRDESGQMFPVLLGASLPGLREGNLSIGSKSFTLEGAVIEMHKKPIKPLICNYAALFLNAPYLWGGRSPFGIDCSGFTQIAYKMAGKNLPRDAWQQAELGTTLSFVEESEPGDLAFFDDEEGNIIHVGILLDEGRIIHASGKVRIDHIDHYGIFNSEIKGYSHKLRLIKKLL
jgi:hypothetical protein